MSRKPGEQIERKDDALRVGLARHNKQDRKVPPFIIEYGGWIVAAAVFLVIVLPFGILGWRSSTDSNSGGVAAGPKVARLEIVGTPSKLWAPGSATRLQSVSVQVANKGTGKAEGVQVWVLAGAKQVVAKGPTTLESAQVDVFSVDIGVDIPEEVVVRIEPECANCAYGPPVRE